MENSHLKEYRCNCGKLLFKGSLVSAVVEVKCKRCEKVNLFEENFSEKFPASLALEINETKSIKSDEPIL